MLELRKTTGIGEYHTLAGIGILIDLVSQAIDKVGANPNDVVLRFGDGCCGSYIHVMYPTPHTYLFNTMMIAKDKIIFTLGLDTYGSKDRHRELPLADPNLIDELAKTILERAKNHRKTKMALNNK